MVTVCMCTDALHVCLHCMQARKDEQLLKRRNVKVEVESPLSESNKMVCTSRGVQLCLC